MKNVNRLLVSVSCTKYQQNQEDKEFIYADLLVCAVTAFVEMLNPVSFQKKTECLTTAKMK